MFALVGHGPNPNLRCTHMTKVSNRSHYTHVLDQWSKAPVKLGPQPTEAQFAIAHVFGRPGKQALGIAMALRDDGMTSAQMLAASALDDGNPTPCRNKLGLLVTNGMFTRDAAGNGVIKLTLAPRGQQWADNKAKAASDATVAAGEVKGKAARVAKAKAPKRASKPAKVTEAVPVVDATPDSVPVPVIEGTPETATVN